MASPSRQDPRPAPIQVRLAGAAILATAIGLAASGCSSSSNAPSAPPPAAAAHKQSSPHVTGQITAVNGSSWTVRGKDGKTYTVSLTAATKFGNKKHPAAQDQFKVGSPVRVAGAITGTTVQATEIRTPGAADSATPNP
jgi:hypothetical protein